ncbi:MAG: FHA domain-containing protein [Methylococcaceae bacterium]|nr:FHA domain-containing protein [Methylococcaceae bacterium]
MEDDKTVMMPKAAPKKDIDPDRTVLAQVGLRVKLLDAQGKTTKTGLFNQAFTVGRLEDNDIVIQHADVSRHHLEVKKENGNWWVYDLNSANGVYLQKRLVKHKAKLYFPASVVLGNTGITLNIQNTDQKAATENQLPEDATIVVLPIAKSATTLPKKLSKEAIRTRLLAEEEEEDTGDYTRMVRKVIREDQKVRVKKYSKVIWTLGGLFLLSVILVVYQQIALSNARTLAIDMFYDIKTLEVNLAQSEEMLDGSSDILDQAMKAVASEKLKAEQERIKAEQAKIVAERERLEQEKQKLSRMKAKYQQYVKEATSFRIRFPNGNRYEEELITRVARQFGESELELPEGFVDEVRRYIKYWQGSPRMQQAMERFEKNNYASGVMAALEKEDLPLQFIYLPLQESSYDTQAIGPETRFGIAKGAWQFLATTGRDYGLTAGPLAGVREYDVQDARFDFKLATRAGAKYLKYIYSTEAQASGLLVMAGYNYGHNRVRELIKKMPNNPRDKNFWKFIQLYQIPKETYDYVFYIFSAAVIGEDPKHFGFKFKPPLAHAS